MKSTQENRQSSLLLAIALVVLFWLVRILPWVLAELWYDEILTLQLFVAPAEGLTEIFRNYRLANNHFLCSAIEWLWLRTGIVSLDNAYLLRLPSILCGIGTIVIIGRWWSRTLGRRVAVMTALVVASSAVFSAFAYQLRGYSLAMMLGAAAVYLAHRHWLRPRLKTGLALFVCSLLLPFVMPAAAMLPCALSLTLAASAWCNGGRRFRNGCRLAWPLLAGAVIGVAYYLTLWPQFQAATRESGGWINGVALTGELVLAAVLHLGMLNAGWFSSLFRSSGTAVCKESEDLFCRLLPWSLLLAVIAVMCVPSPVHRYPFPRVFLVLLPALTYAAACRMRGYSWIRSSLFFHLMVMAILPGILCGILSDSLCRMKLRSTPGAIPQSLCWQYYRSNSPATEAVAALQAKRMPADIPVVVSAMDFPAFSFYFHLYGLENPVIPANHLGARERSLIRQRGRVIHCSVAERTFGDNGATFSTYSRFFWIGPGNDFLSGDHF